MCALCVRDTAALECGEKSENARDAQKKSVQFSKAKHDVLRLVHLSCTSTYTHSYCIRACKMHGCVVCFCL